MSESAPNQSAVEALREAAARLLAKADELEAAGAEAGSVPDVVELQPLAPAASDEEAKARLVALDLATQGVDRAAAQLALERQFPAVDVSSLLDRFFKA